MWLANGEHPVQLRGCRTGVCGRVPADLDRVGASLSYVLSWRGGPRHAALMMRVDSSAPTALENSAVLDAVLTAGKSSVNATSQC